MIDEDLQSIRDKLKGYVPTSGMVTITGEKRSEISHYISYVPKYLNRLMRITEEAETRKCCDECYELLFHISVKLYPDSSNTSLHEDMRRFFSDARENKLFFFAGDRLEELDASDVKTNKGDEKLFSANELFRAPKDYYDFSWSGLHQQTQMRSHSALLNVQSSAAGQKLSRINKTSLASLALSVVLWLLVAVLLLVSSSCFVFHLMSLFLS